MQTTAHDTTIAHVSKSVARHDFLNSLDWATGLSELADLDDTQIEAIASDDEYPAVALYEVSESFLNGLRSHLRRSYRITPAQAQADRALFDRPS